MTGLLVESALRSLALGLVVGVGLWASRVRGSRLRSVAWAATLAAALLMPLLTRWRTVQIIAPQGVVENAPAVIHSLRTAAPLPVLPVRPIVRTNWSTLLAAIWAAGTAVLLLRIITGLLLTLRLWRRAHPLHEPWAAHLRVRETTAIDAPVTFGSGILVPSAWRSWETARLRAVIAHEREHVVWCDFWVQLLARIHAAIYWFSPLSWWLCNRLTVLAEAASDDAAVEAVNDAPAYAEILLHFAARRQSVSAVVAMARPRTVSWRVERILAGVDLRLRATWKRCAVTFLGIASAAAIAAGCSVHAQAPQPEPKREKQSSRWSWSGNPSSDAWVIVSGDSINMSGSSEDVERARRYRDRIHGDYMWLRRDGKSYLITDPATLNRAKALFAPQEELGRKQEELGEKQAELGAKQALLGERQSGVKVKMPALDQQARDLRIQMEMLQQKFRDEQSSALAQGARQMKELQAELQKVKDKELGQDRIAELQERLSEAQSRLSGDFQEHLSELQSRMGELQAEMGELQSRAGEQQALLGEEQSRLGDKQSELGEQQSKLGEEQSRLAEEAARQMKKLFDEALRNGMAQPAP